MLRSFGNRPPHPVFVDRLAVTPLESITISVDRHNPPYVEEQWGELRGASVELVRDAFASQGVSVRFDPVDGVMAQAIHLAAGHADAAADITITQRRLRWFCFSDRYHVEDLQLYTRRHGPLWPGWQHFHGRLGVKADSYAHEFLVRHHHLVPLVPVDSTERLLEILREERVQGIVLSRITGATLHEEGAEEIVASGAPFGPAPLALAALPERAAVLEIFNAGLAMVGGEAERLSPFRPH